MTTTVPELCEGRERAAQALEDAIVALGATYATYVSATRAVERRTGAELGRRMRGRILLVLSKAGLAEFLECHPDPAIPAPALRAVAAQDHHRLRAAWVRDPDDHYGPLA